MPGTVRLVCSVLAVACGCRFAVAQVAGAVAPNGGPADPAVAAKDGGSKATIDVRPAPVRPVPASAPKTVAERKSETLEAMRKGQLVPAGHGSPLPVQ